MEELQQFREQTVSDIKNVIDSVIVGVDLGNVNPLDAFAVFKKMEKLFNEAKKTIDSYAIEEAEKYGSSFEYNGQKFEVRNGATRYSFKDIEEWKIANANLKEIEEKYKTAYKNNKIGLSALDESTGEVLELPTVTNNKSSLLCK